MIKRIAVLGTASAVAAGLIYVAEHHHEGQSTPTGAGSAAAGLGQVPTVPRPSLATTTMPQSSGPVMDSDVGSTPPKPSGSPTAWAPVPTSPASVAPVVKVSSKGAPRGGAVGKVDQRSVDKVAAAFVTSAYVVDARVDASPQAGFARAAQWAAPSYRPYLVAAPARSASAATWRQLQAVKGWTTAQVSPTVVADKPKDTPEATIRSFKVVVTTQGDDENGAQDTVYCYVTAARTAQGEWQITKFEQLA